MKYEHASHDLTSQMKIRERREERIGFGKLCIEIWYEKSGNENFGVVYWEEKDDEKLDGMKNGFSIFDTTQGNKTWFFWVGKPNKNFSLQSSVDKSLFYNQQMQDTMSYFMGFIINLWV